MRTRTRLQQNQKHTNSHRHRHTLTHSVVYIFIHTYVSQFCPRHTPHVAVWKRPREGTARKTRGEFHATNKPASVFLLSRRHERRKFGRNHDARPGFHAVHIDSYRYTAQAILLSCSFCQYLGLIKSQHSSLSSWRRHRKSSRRTAVGKLRYIRGTIRKLYIYSILWQRKTGRFFARGSTERFSPKFLRDSRVHTSHNCTSGLLIQEFLSVCDYI